MRYGDGHLDVSAHIMQSANLCPRAVGLSVIENKMREKDMLTLKWGTLKSWNFHSDKALELLKEYSKLGSTVSVMFQHDNPRQKEIICELIDEGNFEKVYLDWDGKEVSKIKAKKYVMEYKN